MTFSEAGMATAFFRLKQLKVTTTMKTEKLTVNGNIENYVLNIPNPFTWKNALTIILKVMAHIPILEEERKNMTIEDVKKGTLTILLLLAAFFVAGLCDTLILQEIGY